jgi:hypothetical protein
MANYSAEITYARINANNNLLANSNDGNGDGSGATISEVIEAPTHSGYFVSGTPVGNTVIADASVAGVFEAGQYLFYWDASGSPALIGQIDEVSTSTITLVSTILGNGGNMTNRELGVSYSLITSNEEFYIRVKTTKVPSTESAFILMPNFQNWRKVPSQRNESPVLESQSNIQQYSVIGTPVSIDGPKPYVNFKITTTNIFLSSNNGVTYFANWAQFPQYIWLRATVIPSDATLSSLAASTMYRFTTNDFMDNAITVTANTPNATMYNAGYNILPVVINQGGAGQATGGA